MRQTNEPSWLTFSVIWVRAMSREARMALALPDDALAAILGRLPPQSLAACRCVCKAWRAIVDDHGLLLPHVLPHALRGIFFNHRRGRFFARPSSSARPALDGSLDFLPGYGTNSLSILDHCNGLLLCRVNGESLYVVNPATRRWQRLPPCMGGGLDDEANAYMGYDPAVSPHYTVLLIPRVPKKPEPRLSDVADEEVSLQTLLRIWFDTELEDPYCGMEWPPSPWTFHVFSSSTGCWEQRSFLREGQAIGTVEDARLDLLSRPVQLGPRRRYAVYWQGTFYVHCQGAFIMRLSLMNDKYQVLKTPIDINEGKYAWHYLGRSEKGVYYATIHDNSLLRIWVLDEFCGSMEWVLKSNVGLERSAMWAAIHMNNHQRVGPWILKENTSGEDVNNKMVPNDNFEWDSDSDNVLDHVNEVEGRDYEYIHLLGFHPYKEVAFLKVSFAAVAFHLNTSKVQYLGKLCTKRYRTTHGPGSYESFPYTPCLTGEFSEYDQEAHTENS